MALLRLHGALDDFAILACPRCEKTIEQDEFRCLAYQVKGPTQPIDRSALRTFEVRDRPMTPRRLANLIMTHVEGRADSAIIQRSLIYLLGKLSREILEQEPDLNIREAMASELAEKLDVLIEKILRTCD